jgi:hypothetical protein
VLCADARRCYNDGTAGWDRRSLASCDAAPADRGELCARLAAGEVFHADRARECLDDLGARALEPCLARLDLLNVDVDRAWAWSPWSRGPCAEVLDGGPVTPLPPPMPGDCRCPDGWLCLAAATCGGTCTAPSPLGAPCGITGCAEGLHCDYDTHTCHAGCGYDFDCPTGEYCIDASCSPATLPGIGEPCFDRPLGSLCGGTRTYCHAGSHTCELQVGGDVACDGSGGAAACFTGACDSASSTCVPRDSCTPSSNAAYAVCTPAFPYCDVDGHCTASVENAACNLLTVHDGVDVCPPGTACDLRQGEDPGRCRPRAALRAACDEAVVCADGSTCVAGVCVVIAGGGEACGPTVACAGQFACVDGRCAGTTHGGGIGDSCSTEVDCYNGVCTGGRCEWLESGAPCISDRQCRPGYAFTCEHGTCGSYAVVGDGERCNHRDLFCEDGLRCLPTGEQDDRGWVHICRAPCPSP